ncbi:hypothetical protein ACJJTC_010401 [Scirpophaga incertulas]
MFYLNVILIYIFFVNTLLLVFPIEDYYYLMIYRSYIAKFNKNYSNELFIKRMEYFRASLKKIKELNQIHDDAVYGLTKFADQSPLEIEGMFLLPRSLQACTPKQLKSCPPNHRRRYFNNTEPKLKKQIPEKFDWREKNVVGPVLDQKLCRACWAFSIVGVMESMAAIHNMSLPSLSIQELIDCSSLTKGCENGNVVNALNFLCFDNYPIMKSSDYRLELITQPCRAPASVKRHGLAVAGFTSLCNTDAETILELIATHGPVIAAVNAQNWIYYIDGIIQKACPGTWDQLNHVVQIVGYDSTASVPYYIIRNSWGNNFGHGGYLKVAMSNNLCGIASNIVYLDVKEI